MTDSFSDDDIKRLFQGVETRSAPPDDVEARVHAHVMSAWA